MLLDQIILAWKRIKERIMESIMVVLGLGFGIAIVATVLGIILSFRGKMDEQDNSPWKREIRVAAQEHSWNFSGDAITKIGSAEGTPVDFTMDYMESIKELCPSIDYAFFRFGNQHEVTGNGTEGDLSWWKKTHRSNAVTNSYLEFNNLEISEGDLFSETDFEDGSHVVILGGHLAELLFKDQSPLGKVLTYGDLSYTVTTPSCPYFYYDNLSF